MKIRENRIKILALILFILINATQGNSQDGFLSEAENTDAELEQELKWLQEEAFVMTEIATKTKMDADLVPGMVTVLGGRDLEARGIRTVYEALTLVPGLNIHLNSLGDKLVSVRGIGGSLFSGNLKLMLDDVVLNDILSAAGYVIYDIPVEQVERIEIIRGPGSVIYGEYAYAGVINVTTRKKNNRIYGRYDNYDSYGGGLTAAYAIPEKEFRLSLNLSGWKTDGPDVITGEDRLYSGFAGMKLGDFSYAPGPTNEAQEDKFMNVSLEYRGFSFSGQYLLNGKGDYFGFIHVLPPPNDSPKQFNEHSSLEAGYQLDFSDALKADINAGWRRYEFDTDTLIGVPPLLMVPLPDGSTIDITPADGSLARPYYEETERFGIAEVIWEGKHHTFLAGMKYSDTEMGDIWVDTNTEEVGKMIRLEGENSWIAGDHRRRVFSFYLQDMFDITDHLTLTGGLRYDHYDDMGESLTPRLSAVWRLTDHHILKAQYSEAVRPPSFTELYAQGNSLFKGNPDLDSEHIRNGELGYIYRNSKTVGRVTLFYSEMEDNIEYPKYADSFGGLNIQYRNADDITKTKGFELEFENDLRDDLRLSMNLSFANTEDEEGNPLDGATDWLGNVGLLYRPFEDYTLSLQYRYVGKRHRMSDDGRKEPDAYSTLDLSTGIHNLFTKRLILRTGIRNLSNSSIVYPAPVYKDENGNIGYYYPDDFPRPGRQWWVQLSYNFD